MSGRDIHEAHRVSTPLELLFDLTFVVAIAAAAAQLHHAAAAHHLAQGLLGFVTTFFAIWWAWMTSPGSPAPTTPTIPLSAHDHGADGRRPRARRGRSRGRAGRLSDHHHGVCRDARGLVALWLRAAHDHPERRQTCQSLRARHRARADALGAAPAPAEPWTAPLLRRPRTGGDHHPGVGCEGRAHALARAPHRGAIWPVHDHRPRRVRARRDERRRWRHRSRRAGRERRLVGFGSASLVLALWWVYFLVPSGDALHAHRERAFRWGYGHAIVFLSLAALGAFLGVVADQLETLSTRATTTEPPAPHDTLVSADVTQSRSWPPLSPFICSRCGGWAFRSLATRPASCGVGDELGSPRGRRRRCLAGPAFAMGDSGDHAGARVRDRDGHARHREAARSASRSGDRTAQLGAR
jgi:hypothetical protein